MPEPRRVPFGGRRCIHCNQWVRPYTGSFWQRDPNQRTGPGKGWSIIHDPCRRLAEAEQEARQEAYDQRLFELDEED